MGPGDFSALHRLQEDEIYHYYTGSPIELLQLHPDGTGSVTLCGPEFWHGQQPQVVVKHGTWQGSAPARSAKLFAPRHDHDPRLHRFRLHPRKARRIGESLSPIRRQIKALTRP